MTALSQTPDNPNPLRKPVRSLLFTDACKETILNELLKGNSLHVAAGMAKIPYATAQTWRKKGKDELDIYVLQCEQWDERVETMPFLMEYGHFEQGCQWAEAGFLSQLHDRWRALEGKGEWQAEAKYLEAMHRKFAKQETVNVNSKSSISQTVHYKVTITNGDDFKDKKLHSGDLKQLPPGESEDAIFDTMFADEDVTV